MASEEPRSTTQGRDVDDADDEIARLLEQERARLSRRASILLLGGCLGIVMGAATLAWYQGLDPKDLQDVARGVVTNMAAACGLLALLLGVAFVAMALYVRRLARDEQG